jgi:hypothetical protein
VTPQQAKELVPVLTAYAEGKVVQFRVPEAVSPLWHEWTDYSSEQTHLHMDFCNLYAEWRIKPSPREWFVGVPSWDRHTILKWAATPAHAHILMQRDHAKTTYDVVHVREVLP